MSRNGQHMGVKVADIRGSVEASKLKKALRGVTWRNIRFRLVSLHEYGNTLYSDLFIMLNYFKEGFVMYRAAERCGYSGGTRANRNSNLTNRIKYRLQRMNFGCVLDIALAMLAAKLLSVEDIAVIITRQTKTTGKKPERHPVYKYYTKRLVCEAIERWGWAGAAQRLGVSVDWIRHWENMDVTNILVTPRR